MIVVQANNTVNTTQQKWPDGFYLYVLGRNKGSSNNVSHLYYMSNIQEDVDYIIADCILFDQEWLSLRYWRQQVYFKTTATYDNITMPALLPVQTTKELIEHVNQMMKQSVALSWKFDEVVMKFTPTLRRLGTLVGVTIP